MTVSTPHLHAVDGISTQAGSGRTPYSPTFKSGAVARVRAGQPIAQVARSVGVSRNTLKAWMTEPLPAPGVGGVAAAAASGSRRAVLVALRDEVAAKIGEGVSARDLPTNARLLDETMRAIEALDALESQASEGVTMIPDEPFNPDDI